MILKKIIKRNVCRKFVEGVVGVFCCGFFLEFFLVLIGSELGVCVNVIGN